MANKKVYIIRLSEDGNYGVYSNMKKAFGAAKECINYYENSVISKFDKNMQLINVPTTYQNMVSEINKNGYASIEGNGNTMEITVFYLNQ